MKKILVIEDWADTRNFFVECLKIEGFSAIGAENGFIGIHLAKKHLPDLIICDIVMPDLDGYGTLTTLRQDINTAMIPFIFLTAKVTKSDRRKGMELGADDYLTKPCTVEELLRAIAAQLKKQSILQQWCFAKSQQVPKLPLADTAEVTEPFILPSIPQMREVFDFIEANYHRPITLGDVAQVVDYSPAYLTDLVRRETGQTLYRWVIERRMAQARYLLLVTSQSVQEIAKAVGYLDTGNFIQQFRRFNNMTPQVWRQAHRS